MIYFHTFKIRARRNVSKFCFGRKYSCGIMLPKTPVAAVPVSLKYKGPFSGGMFQGRDICVPVPSPPEVFMGEKNHQYERFSLFFGKSIWTRGPKNYDKMPSRWYRYEDLVSQYLGGTELCKMCVREEYIFLWSCLLLFCRGHSATISFLFILLILFVRPWWLLVAVVDAAVVVVVHLGGFVLPSFVAAPYCCCCLLLWLMPPLVAK